MQSFEKDSALRGGQWMHFLAESVENPSRLWAISNEVILFKSHIGTGAEHEPHPQSQPPSTSSTADRYSNFYRSRSGFPREALPP
jgi:hypothetical protein